MADSTKVIKSVNYNQHAILRDILDLHCGGGEGLVIVDPCYSVGNFYGKFKRTIKEKQYDGCVIEKQEEFEIPQPTYKFDVNPQVEGCEQIDPWGKWPLGDACADVVILDPPFIIAPRDRASMKNGKKNSNTIAKRFSSFYPRYEMFETYEHLLSEAYRVLKDGGVLIFKSQNVISGGLSLMTSYYTCKVAEDMGFYIKDEFVLIAKNRLISSKVHNQMQSRKYHSFFHVFVKNDPKRNKIGYFKRDWRKHKEDVIEIPLVNESEQ